MTLVYVIVFLNFLNSPSGMVTGADGKPLTFASKSACETERHARRLDNFEVMGQHGKCELRAIGTDGVMRKMGTKRHRHGQEL